MTTFFCHPLASSLDMVYQCAEFDNSSVSRSRDIVQAQKFKIGHMTLTTPVLLVICHPNA